MNLFETIGFVGIATSIVYMIMTRSYGSPLRDSYTDTQLEIKRSSSTRRRRAYIIGVAAGVVAYLIAKQKRMF